MRVYYMGTGPVNTFLLTKDKNFYVKTTSGDRLEIPQDPRFGPWWCKTQFQHMTADEPGKSWYLANNPMTFPISPVLLNTPKPHQILALTRRRIGNCAMWLDMGLGKTYIAIAYMLYLHALGQKNNFLIVCPLSVTISWLQELEKHINPDFKYKMLLLHGPKKEKELKSAMLNYADIPHFMVTNYESLQKLNPILKDCNIANIEADESSRIKNLDTARTKSMFELRDNCPKASRFCSSGTPSTTNVLGYYSQLEWLNSGSTKHASFKSFEMRYCNSNLYYCLLLPNGRQQHIAENNIVDWLEENGYSGYSISYNKKSGDKTIKILYQYKRVWGAKNIEELNNTNKLWSYAVKKSEVAKDLPEKTFVVRHVKMPESQKKFYQDFVDKNLEELQKVINFGDTNSAHSKLHQIANGFILDSGQAKFFKEQPKLDELECVLEEAGDQRVVIWAPYVAQINQINAFLLKLGRKPVVIMGETSLKARFTCVEQFNSGEANILLANPSAAGLGLNLTVSCLEIFMANWSYPDVRSQAIDRLHRIGQTQPVTVMDLVVKGTIEVKILSNWSKQVKIENQVLQRSDLIGDDT